MKVDWGGVVMPAVLVGSLVLIILYGSLAGDWMVNP